DAVLVPHDGRAALRAGIGQAEGRGALRALALHYLQHLGDYLARLADDDRGAYPDVELVYEVLVVQRGVRHRCAREADRLDDRLGRQDARAPHLDDDIAHDALLLLRRILVSGSPARGLGRAAQLHALGQGVYLDDRAVNVVWEISPVLPYTFNRCLAVFKAAADGIGYGVK